MRVLIVKLSSMGDVIHSLPVVQDLRLALPEAQIDWVVEPSFAPLVRRAEGIAEVIEAPLRRWVRRWWSSATRSEFRCFRARLRRERYDAILDLQGLTKSAFIAAMARGHRYAMANRTEGSGYEAATRWVAQHAIDIEPRIHALDRSRVLAAKALRYTASGPPDFGLRVQTPFPSLSALTPSTQPHHPDRGTIALLHGSSRDDKLWPEDHWLALGRELLLRGWQLALPQGSEAEGKRAQRLSEALGIRCVVWPRSPLDELIDELASCSGAIGVDSGLSHLAVALDLPHVQLYNLPTAWRTGPLVAHGHRHQVALVGKPMPSVDAVLEAWQSVSPPEKHIHMASQAMSRTHDFADDEILEPPGLPVRPPPASSVS